MKHLINITLWICSTVNLCCATWWLLNQPDLIRIVFGGMLAFVAGFAASKAILAILDAVEAYEGEDL
jgi:hypothetical protein